MTAPERRPTALPFAALIAGAIWAGLLSLCVLTLISLAGRARAEGQSAASASTGVVTLTLRAPNTLEGTPRRNGVTALPTGTVILTELLNQVRARSAAGAALAAATPGQILEEGAELQTDAGSAARLDFDDGAITRLGATTTVVLEAIAARGGSPSTILALDEGKLWLSLRGRPVEVRTPLGSVIVHGEFAGITYQAGAAGRTNDDALVVSCFKGPCAFQGQSSGDVVGDLTRLTISQGGAQSSQQPLGAGEVEAFIDVNPEAAALRALAGATAAPTLAETGAPPGEIASPPASLVPQATPRASGYPAPPAATQAPEQPTASATLFSAFTATATIGTPGTPATPGIQGTPGTPSTETGTPGTATPSPTGPTPTLATPSATLSASYPAPSPTP